MRSFYSDLGISRTADSRQIRAAYRALVKRLHPDLNPQTPATAAELAKVNAAYAVLGHKDRRASYDKELGLARQAARRRLAGQGAIAVFTCAVAFSVILIVLPLVFTGMPSSDDRAAAPPPLTRAGEERLTQGEVRGLLPAPVHPHLHEGEPVEAPPRPAAPPLEQFHEEPRVRTAGRARPPDAAKSARRKTLRQVREAARDPPPQRLADEVPRSEGEREGVPVPRQKAVALLGASEAFAASRQVPTPVAWKSFGAARMGFAVRYPASHFPNVRWSERARDLLALSKDGRAVFRARSENASGGESLAAVRRRLLGGRYANADLVRNELSDTELTIAGRLHGETFFKRVVLACNRAIRRSILIIYPVTETAHFEPLVAEMSASVGIGSASPAHCAR